MEFIPPFLPSRSEVPGGALRRAVIDGNVKSGPLLAGQSVDLVNKIQPVKEIFDELVVEIEEELQKVKRELG